MEGSAYADASPRNTLTSSSGVVVAINEGVSRTPLLAASQPPASKSANTGLAFDEEAKLVYGVVLSLRNMIRKLSGRYASHLLRLAYYSIVDGQR